MIQRQTRHRPPPKSFSSSYVWRQQQSDQTVERQVFKGRQAYSAIKPSAEPADPTVDVKTLHAKIGKLTLENDVFSVRSAKLLERFTF